MHKIIIVFLFLISFKAMAEYKNDLDCSNSPPIFPPNEGHDSTEIDRWFITPHQVKAIGIAFHGLNAKPSMMNPLIDFLNGQGVSVLRGSLKGHRGSLEEMEVVKREDWLRDVFRTYCLAKEQADKKGLPLIYVGHSLGALIIFDLLSTHQKKLKLDKAILFAPSFKIHWHLNFFSFIFNLKDSWSLPSRNLPRYRSQAVCTFAAYKALMDSIDSFKPEKIGVMNIPTLVLMDPDDELVDFDGISDMIKTYKLGSWRLIPVDTSGTTHKKIYRHLAFNKDCFGDTEWNRIEKIMEDFLWAANGMK